MEETGARVVSFWLPPELIAGLDKIAEETFRTRNRVVRDTLTELVESCEGQQSLEQPRRPWSR